MSYENSSVGPSKGPRRIVFRLAVTYALLSICMMLISMVIGNEFFALVTLVAFSPLFGYFFATVGRMDTEIAIDGAFYVQLLINALWCFVFAWVLGRVVLGLLDVASRIYKKRRNETEH